MLQATIDLEKTYTLDEFMDLDPPDEDGRKYELWEGKIVASPQPGSDHAAIANMLAYYLTDYVLKQQLGKVWSNGTFKIGNIRNGLAPDIAFIAHPDVPARTSKAVQRHPGLAIEILSPRDRAGEAQAKTKKYLKAGVKLVWIVNPAKRTAEVYRKGQESATTIHPTGELDGEDLLPGFKLPIKSLFE